MELLIRITVGLAIVYVSSTQQLLRSSMAYEMERSSRTRHTISSSIHLQSTQGHFGAAFQGFLRSIMRVLETVIFGYGSSFKYMVSARAIRVRTATRLIASRQHGSSCTKLTLV